MRSYYFVMMARPHQLASAVRRDANPIQEITPRLQYFPIARSHESKIATCLPNSRCKDKNIQSWSVDKNEQISDGRGHLLGDGRRTAVNLNEGEKKKKMSDKLSLTSEARKDVESDS